MLAASAGAFLVPRPAAAAPVRAAMHRNPEVASHAYTPKVYDAHEWATVQLLVNYVIPTDAVSGSQRTPRCRSSWTRCSTLNRPCELPIVAGWPGSTMSVTRATSSDFVDCTDAQRRLLLDAIAYPAQCGHRNSRRDRPGSVRFRDFTATGFFTSELGVERSRLPGQYRRCGMDRLPD